jgi:hypothetical protein
VKASPLGTVDIKYVHVEHVHVNDGGQAVIGNVKKEGGQD